MATGKKRVGSKTAKKAKPSPQAKRTTKAKPAAKKPPAKKSARAKVVKRAKSAKAASRPASRAGARPVKAAAKPARAGAKVVGKPAVKGAAVVGKPAVKGSGKPAPRVVGRPAVKGPARPEPPAKPVKAGPRRLVPATAEAKALARAPKTPTGKTRLVNKPAPEVRPLGVLPPESQASPKMRGSARPIVPARSAARPIVAVKAAAKRDDDRLTPEDIQHFKQRLLEERVKIMREMGYLESTLLKVTPRDAAGELSGYSSHMADAGTDTMERETAFNIASKEGRLLMEIDDALRRLYGGAYGLCEMSGKPISRARLEALPWARLSLEEQEKMEKEQRAGRMPAKEE